MANYRAVPQRGDAGGGCRTSGMLVQLGPCPIRPSPPWAAVSHLVARSGGAAPLGDSCPVPTVAKGAPVDPLGLSAGTGTLPIEPTFCAPPATHRRLPLIWRLRLPLGHRPFAGLGGRWTPRRSGMAGVRVPGTSSHMSSIPRRRVSAVFQQQATPTISFAISRSTVPSWLP